MNLLTATASDLRKLLETGKCTTVDIVKEYLTQIALHNHYGMKMHAVISTPPTDQILELGHELDIKREKTGPRSRLHGIPIIIKVNLRECHLSLLHGLLTAEAGSNFARPHSACRPHLGRWLSNVTMLKKMPI